MFIQFDGEIADPDALLAQLRLAGIPARAVRSSRWIGRLPGTNEPADAGGRLDVELTDEPLPAARPKIAQLAAFLAAYAA